MRDISFWAILFLTLTAPQSLTVSARSDDQPADNKLSPLDWMIGEWEINAHWTNGESLHARNVIDWGVGKKFITGKTYVTKSDGTEYQRYDSVFGFHPKKKCLFQISFTYAGEINETVIERVTGDTIHVGWTPFDPDQPSNVRQIIKITGKDNYVWTVLAKDGDNWKKLIEGTWNRKK